MSASALRLTDSAFVHQQLPPWVSGYPHWRHRHKGLVSDYHRPFPLPLVFDLEHNAQAAVCVHQVTVCDLLSVMDASGSCQSGDELD